MDKMQSQYPYLQAVAYISDKHRFEEIEALRSQLDIGMPLMYCDQVLELKWKNYIRLYGELLVNNIVFLVSKDGCLVEFLEGNDISKFTLSVEKVLRGA